MLDRFIELLEDGREEFDSEYLYDKLEPDSMFALDSLLADMVHTGMLKSRIRVLTPYHAGKVAIGEYDNYADIPAELEDENREKVFEVTPDLVQIVYVARR